MASTSTRHRHVTTIRLPPSVWLSAQRLAIDTGVSLNALVAAAVKRYVEQEQPPSLFAER